jgi:hypothetical protein
MRTIELDGRTYSLVEDNLEYSVLAGIEPDDFTFADYDDGGFTYEDFDGSEFEVAPESLDSRPISHYNDEAFRFYTAEIEQKPVEVGETNFKEALEMMVDAYSTGFRNRNLHWETKPSYDGWFVRVNPPFMQSREIDRRENCEINVDLYFLLSDRKGMEEMFHEPRQEETRKQTEENLTQIFEDYDHDEAHMIWGNVEGTLNWHPDGEQIIHNTLHEF